MPNTTAIARHALESAEVLYAHPKLRQISDGLAQWPVHSNCPECRRQRQEYLRRATAYVESLSKSDREDLEKLARIR